MDNLDLDTPSYREPLRPLPTVTPLDAALAREVYESRLAATEREEARQRKAREKQAKARARRPHRVRIEPGPYPFLVIDKGRGELMSDRAMAMCMAGVFAFVPSLVVVLGWSAGLMPLVIIGAVLTLVAFPFGVWLVKDEVSAESLRLRVTPLHYEIFSGNARYIGERDELRLSVRDDERFDINTHRQSFRFDELAHADVQIFLRFVRQVGFEVG